MKNTYEDAVALVSEGLWTVREAAAFLGMGRSAVYELMNTGELPWVKIGRSRRVPKRAVVELAAREVRGLEYGG